MIEVTKLGDFTDLRSKNEDSLTNPKKGFLTSVGPRKSTVGT